MRPLSAQSVLTAMVMQDELSIPLHAEELMVTRQETVTGMVRVNLQTHTREQVIDENLASERVEIERVAIGCVVEIAPGIREEGDTTIIPVVEEVLITEKRLVLKEEIRMTRVRTTERHQETVRLRHQQATVERTGGRSGSVASDTLQS